MACFFRYRPTGDRSVRRALICLSLSVAALSLSSCASLPTSGPTVHQVLKESRSGQTSVPFTVVPVDAEVVRRSTLPVDPGIVKLAALASTAGPARADLIRPGDTLAIGIFEVGVSLFGGSALPGPGAGTAARSPAAGTQALTIEVREDGFIDLPYAGSVMAAGAYPEELAGVIRRRLKTLSESPAVSVTIADTVKSVVYLGGAVIKSGRFRLTAAHERLLDAVAIAGGSAVDPNELELHLRRGAQEVSVPFNRISPGAPADVVLQPGDRIQLVRVRPSFTVFGASDKLGQIYFESKEISLAEAIARASGPSDYRANPRGVFLCRYEIGPDGMRRPVVYQLNMMKTDAYFLAQQFSVRDKDVILFANSSGTMTQKLVNLLSNLFSPIMAVRYAAQ
uniref:polysaccharide biosynthesis/export family protein n=1 Tax=uncultured Sphingomonas sp. TaxID=158754 RepID=UPI0035C9860C